MNTSPQMPATQVEASPSHTLLEQEWWRIRREQWPEAIGALALLTAATFLLIAMDPGWDEANALLPLALAATASGALLLSMSLEFISAPVPEFARLPEQVAQVLAIPLGLCSLYYAYDATAGLLIATVGLVLALAGWTRWVRSQGTNVGLTLQITSLTLSALSIRQSLDVTDPAIDGAVAAGTIGLAAGAFHACLIFTALRWRLATRTTTADPAPHGQEPHIPGA